MFAKHMFLLYNFYSFIFRVNIEFNCPLSYNTMVVKYHEDIESFRQIKNIGRRCKV